MRIVAYKNDNSVSLAFLVVFPYPYFFFILVSGA